MNDCIQLSDCELVIPNLIYKPRQSVIALEVNKIHDSYRVNTIEEMQNNNVKKT